MKNELSIAKGSRLESLSHELILAILRTVSLKDLARLRAVNRFFRYFVEGEDFSQWQKYFPNKRKNRSPTYFRMAHDQFQNPDIHGSYFNVLAAVKRDGFALKYAADELKSDREIVLAAVKLDGNALKYASDALKADRGIVLAAVKRDGFALKCAADELKSDRGDCVGCC